ncbi:MAG: TonB-dependent receptor, partial [Thermodesulfobacteriota bacterium]|nr:TonB-dependent receptor [Thermodesulfobacteriota bacterium]
AYVQGRERHSHAYLNSIPPLNGLLGMRWQDEVAEGVKYWIEFSSSFYARQDHTAAGEKETAGYALCNVRSGVTFDYAGCREVTLTLNVENLLDKEYRSHLNTEGFYNNPGLNVVTALKFSF